MPTEHPEPDCWLDPRVKVGLSSIHGSGLFAASPIPVGATVSRLGGQLVSGDELGRLLSSPGNRTGHYVDTIAVDDHVHLVLPPGSANHYGNHSCDPNLWWSSPYTLTARRRIEIGEELTNDYATSTGADEFMMACSCGSTLCRGVVTGGDWRRQELEDRYTDHWVPALLRRIEETRRQRSQLPSRHGLPT